MAGTAAALGCAAPTREGKAMGRQATAGESTDKGGDGRAEQGIAAAWLGTAPRGKCMVGKARAKIGIAGAEDCVGQLRRCKARRCLAAAEHRNARQGGGEAQLRGCGAGRRIDPHKHGAVRAAMAALWCAGAQRFLATALSGDDGMARALASGAKPWQGTEKARMAGAVHGIGKQGQSTPSAGDGKAK